MCYFLVPRRDVQVEGRKLMGLDMRSSCWFSANPENTSTFPCSRVFIHQSIGHLSQELLPPLRGGLDLIALTFSLWSWPFLPLNEHSNLLKHQKTWCSLVQKAAVYLFRNNSSRECAATLMLFDVLIFWRTLWLRLQKCFALLGWLMSWWVKLQTLETSVFQWHLETESKWLRSKRYNQKYFCLFLCRSCQVHWRKGLKKYFKKNWVFWQKWGVGLQRWFYRKKETYSEIIPSITTDSHVHLEEWQKRASKICWYL